MKGICESIVAMVVAAALGEAVSGKSMRGFRRSLSTLPPSAGIQLGTLAPVELNIVRDHWTDEMLAREFSPQLRFDSKAETFPQNPVWYWENSHTDSNGDRRMNGAVPSSWERNPDEMATTYNVERCHTGRVLIEYWFFYSYQNPCFLDWFGAHNGDWERVVVALNAEMTQVDRITYHQHSGRYTKDAGNFELEDGTHPVVYVGKKSHGSYHDNGGMGGCAYFQDWRNQGTVKKRYSSWSEGTLLPTYGDAEWQNFEGKWGADGVKGPKGKAQDVCSRTRCADDGCSKNNGGNNALLEEL